jgi:hypothetical protein
MQVRAGQASSCISYNVKAQIARSLNLGYYPSWQTTRTASILPDSRVAGCLLEPSPAAELRRRPVGDGSCSAAALPITVVATVAEQS